MDENYNGDPDTLIQEPQDYLTTDDDIETIKAEKTKAEEIAHNMKIRAEKAERELRESKERKGDAKPQASGTQDRLSDQDLIAVITNKVNQKDLPEIAEYAKMKGLSIAEALETNVVKSIMKDNEEMRATAKATNTTTTARGTSKVSDESLLNSASEKGILPESDEDMIRLVKARKGIK